MQRTSLSIVVALLSFPLLAAADDDLPDLEKVVERHRALFESIRTGRITYVRERTLGTTDLAEFKKYSSEDAEKRLRQAEAAGADEDYLRSLQRQLDSYAAKAAMELLRSIEHQRISTVFDKGTNSARDDVTDLRDVAGMMSRYGVHGDIQANVRSSSRSIVNDTQKILRGQPPLLSIDPWKRGLSIEPLRFAGYLIDTLPMTADDDERVESAQMRRDTDNPNLIIYEMVGKPQTTERIFVRKGGKFESVEVPLDEPRAMKILIVLDESKDYRPVSTSMFLNDRLTIEYSFEHSSDDPLSLPKVVTVTMYRDDGSAKGTLTLRMESVELNVEIAASEFEIDIPPGTTIYDNTGSEPLVIKPDELHEIAEEVEDALDAEATPAEVEEVPAEAPEAPDPVEAVEAPAPVEEEPAPAQDAPHDDGGGSIMTVGIAFIVIAAIIAVALWARRRQRN